MFAYKYLFNVMPGAREDKQFLFLIIVQRQANEEKKHGKLKGVFKHSINYEINKVKNAGKANLDTNILF
jgi:hypothetical protein